MITLEGTIIEACTTFMWKGIRLMESSTIKVEPFIDTGPDPDEYHYSEINDAQYAISARERSRLYLDNFDATGERYLTLRRNYVSLYTSPLAGTSMYDVDFRLGNMLITGDQTNMLVKYIDQTPTFSNSQSYAGMLLNNVDVVVGISTSNNSRIKFRFLNNGIIAMNSVLDVKNSAFVHIKDFDAFPMPMNANNGTCIFAGADLVNYGALIQKGLGYGSSPPLTFDKCDYGIHTNHVSTDISENKMDEIELIGIRCENTGNRAVKILNNEIATYSIGIYLANNRRSYSFDVSGNDISSGTNSTFPLPASFGILYDGTSHPLQSLSDLYQINCNNIEGDFTTGMQITGMYSNKFITLANNAYVKNNFINMNSSYMTTGIRLLNNAGVILNSNKVFGNDITKGSAFEFNSFNYNLLVSDNKSDKTFYGFSFLGPNPNTKFITNEIGQVCASCSTTVHNTGFYLDGSAEIGDQFEIVNGNFVVYDNKWKANPTSTTSLYSSGFGAWNDNCTINGALASQFYVPSGPSGTMDYPDNSCSLGGAWFLTANNTTSKIPAFDGDCSGYPQFANPDNNSLDRKIAWDSITTEIYQTQTRFFLSSYLNDKLLLNNSLVENDSLFGAFFDNNSSNVIGQLSLVRFAIKNIFNDDSLTVCQIIKSDSTIHNLFSDKSIFMDSLVECTSYADSSLLSEKIKQISGNLFSEINYLNELYNDLESARQIKIQLADSLNDLVSTSEDIESNEQELNKIFLNKIVNNDYNLDSTEYATLYFIANQCPFLGGNSVYNARAILRTLNDTSSFDDGILCEPESSPRLANKNKSLNTGNVNVSPNPSPDKFVFTFKLPKDESGSLLIIDNLGQPVYFQEISANKIEIMVNLNKLNEGIYFFKITSNESVIGTGKMAVIK